MVANERRQQPVQLEQTIGLLDETLRYRHSAAEAKCAARHLQTGYGLGALVFIEIDPSLHPPNSLFAVAVCQDIGDAELLLDIKLENGI